MIGSFGKQIFNTIEAAKPLGKRYIVNYSATQNIRHFEFWHYTFADRAINSNFAASRVDDAHISRNFAQIATFENSSNTLEAQLELEY